VTVAGSVLQVEPAAVAYPAVFGLASLACFVAIPRARGVEAADVRRGLVWLLWTTGGWALLKLGFLTLPAPFREPAYTAGLVLGFATVWAWLYFCSAYAGRSYHRNRTLRRLGTGVFLGVVCIKLTNRLHGLYFTTREASEPFAHLAIEHGVFHWAVTGLSYALAAVGIFVLFELYHESGYDTRLLAVLTLLLGLPIAVDILAYTTPVLIGTIYAPLGVALFVIGVLFVYERRFLAVQSTGDDEDPVVFLDDEYVIRDYTPAAVETFPALEGALGKQLGDRLPEVADALAVDEQVLAYERSDGTNYYLVSQTELTLGDAEGSLVLFSDITTAEKRQRELDRHNTQLEGFAKALAHELRNMLQIIDWRLAVASDRLEEGTVEYESIESAMEAHRRLTDRVDEFTTLARYGQTVERVQNVSLRTIAEDTWWHTETGGMDLEFGTEGTVECDPGRLQELLTNAFEFAHLNGADTVRIDLLEGALVIADDGEPPGEDAEGYLAFGESIPDAESGMKLPNVRTFSRVHGWEVTVDTGYQDGVRLVIDGVTTDPGGDVDADGGIAGDADSQGANDPDAEHGTGGDDGSGTAADELSRETRS